MRVLLPRGPGGGLAGDGGPWDGPMGYGENVPTSALNAAFMDVAFVGKPLQCREPVCEQLKHMFEWRRYQPWQDAWLYKYIMDVSCRCIGVCVRADRGIDRREWVERAI